MSHDMLPRIARPDSQQSIWYAVGNGGNGGNGVWFSTWAGKRLAERVTGTDAGRDVFKLPIYESPLFAPFRRLGQRVLYKWYWLRDEKLQGTGSIDSTSLAPC